MARDAGRGSRGRRVGERARHAGRRLAHADGGRPAGDGEPWLPRHKRGLFWRRFRVAFARALLHVRRQRVLVAVTALEHVLVGLLYGSNYYAPPRDYAGFLDVSACLFFTYVCAAVSSGAKAIPDFFALKTIAMRERAAGALGPHAQVGWHHRWRARDADAT